MTQRVFAHLVFLFLYLATTATQAQVCERGAAGDRPKIGLALGGGGARGEAHIGVLKRLEELRVPVDFVAGTSIGSIIGGLVGAGVDSSEMEEIIAGIDWNSLFSDSPSRADLPFRRKRDDDFALYGPKLGIGKDASLLPGGAIAGQKILFLFESIVNERTQVQDFDDLPIPFRAVATDIYTGDEVIIDKGSVALAMRSSMAVPAIFSPVPYEGKLLVDGGLANNVPVSVLKGMGADVVIAVDVGSGLKAPEDVNNLLAITGQLTNIMVNNTTKAQLALLSEDDVLIVPALGDKVGSADFDKVSEAVPIGYQAALDVSDDLSRLSLSVSAYDAYRGRVDSCKSPRPVVQWVEINNQTRFRDSIIADRLNVEVGKPLDIQQLDQDLLQLQALGFLKIARYEIRERNGERGVYVEVLPDDRGTTLLEYGFDIFGDSDSSAINARVGVLKTDIDNMGAELRGFVQLGEDQAIYGELYKPLDNVLRTIVLPSLYWSQQDFSEFDEDGREIRQFEVERYGGTFALAREFGRHAALSGGVRLYGGNVKVNIGPRDEPDFDYNGGEVFARFDWDRLDDRYVPSYGSSFVLEYLRSADGLGADDDFEQLIFSAFGARTWGRHTLLGALRYNTTLDSDAPVYALFRAGGFANLSGFEFNEIGGQHYGMGLLGYRYRLNESGLLPGFVGGTVEYGNVAEDRDDVFDDGLWHGSFYLSYKTPLGPMYLGLGFGEDADETYFLRIGNIFNRTQTGR